MSGPGRTRYRSTERSSLKTFNVRTLWEMRLRDGSALPSSQVTPLRYGNGITGLLCSVGAHPEPPPPTAALASTNNTESVCRIYFVSRPSASCGHVRVVVWKYVLERHVLTYTPPNADSGQHRLSILQRSLRSWYKTARSRESTGPNRKSLPRQRRNRLFLIELVNPTQSRIRPARRATARCSSPRCGSR